MVSWLFHELGRLVSTTRQGCLSESACRSRSRAWPASLASSRESMTSRVRAVPLGEEQAQGLDDPGAAQVTDPLDRAGYGGFADVRRVR